MRDFYAIENSGLGELSERVIICSFNRMMYQSNWYLLLTFLMPLKLSVKLTSRHFGLGALTASFLTDSCVHTHTYSRARKQTVRCNSFSWQKYEVSCQDAWSGAAESEICSHADNLWASIWSALRPCWWSKFLTVGGRTVGCCPWEPLAFILLTSRCIYLACPLVSSDRLTWRDKKTCL